MGQPGAVDGITGAGDEAAAADADPLSGRELALFRRPAGNLLGLVQTSHELTGVDLEIVRRRGVGPARVQPADFYRIDAQIFSDHVQLTFESIARLGHSMAALRRARGQVGVHAEAVELEIVEFIDERQHRSGVIRRGDAQAGVGSAVENVPAMHPGDLAFFGNAGGQLDVLGVAPAVMKEDFLAIENDFDRPAGFHRQRGADVLGRRRLQLAAEAAADEGLDHAHIAHLQSEHAGDVVLKVVGRLGAGPDGELAVFPFADGGVRLHGGVIGPVALKAVGPDVVALMESLFHVAEFLVYLDADVALVLRVDLGLVFVHRRERVQNRRQDLVFDVDQAERLDGGLLVHRGHGRNLVADLEHFFDGEYGLVVAGRGDAVKGRRHVLRRNDGLDARQPLRLGGVDAEDPGVGVGAAQDLADEHAGHF